MRKMGLFAIIFSLVFLAVPVFLQSSGHAEEEEIPEGMEIKKVGDLQILVPKGANVEKTGKGGLITVESTSEFTSRKILELEKSSFILGQTI